MQLFLLYALFLWFNSVIDWNRLTQEVILVSFLQNFQCTLQFLVLHKFNTCSDLIPWNLWDMANLLGDVHTNIFHDSFDILVIENSQTNKNLDTSNFLSLFSIFIFRGNIRVILTCLWVIFDYHYSENIKLCPLLVALSLSLFFNLCALSDGTNSAEIR